MVRRDCVPVDVAVVVAVVVVVVVVLGLGHVAVSEDGADQEGVAEAGEERPGGSLGG